MLNTTKGKKYKIKFNTVPKKQNLYKKMPNELLICKILLSSVAIVQIYIIPFLYFSTN